MNTTFLLTGGAGRIICAEPALREYHRLNPDDDFKVLVHGWNNLYYSHPLLQNRTYDLNMKGAFDLIVKNSLLIYPEPYHNRQYYNQEISLAEAFHQEINESIIHDHDTPKYTPRLYLHEKEDLAAKRMIKQAKEKFNKNKFIVFQPFGSCMNDNFEDSSGRSMHKKGFDHLINLMRSNLDAVVLYFGETKYFEGIDNILTAKDVPDADLRFFMAMIANCDYFVGIDSVGQHMARSFYIPGLVIMGSTFEKNVTYPNWFTIYRKDGFFPTYNPIRISPLDNELTDRINSGIMNFTGGEIEEIFEIINKGL